MTGDRQDEGRARIPVWGWLALAVLMAFCAWWRGHTVGPSIAERTGWRLWPETRGETEPLDCDEAAYGYIGRRLADGAVMYRDVSENKPPGGYWIYALAVKVAGASELTVRLMPVPMVLASLAMVFWLGWRVSGVGAGIASAGVFALLSTDPYLYGNGANLEHAMNLFSVGSLAAMVASWKGRRGWVVLAGVLVGCSSLVKQVEALVGPVYALALWFRSEEDSRGQKIRRWLGDLLALATGFLAIWGLAVAVLMAQGAGADAWHDIVELGSAIASAPAGAHERPLLIRWITGNADPRPGATYRALPWPFGETDYLVWWGTGSWPVWLAAVPGLGVLWFGAPRGVRRLLVLWTLAAWMMVALPRMFWAHYYLLPTPGVSLAVGVGLVESAQGAARAVRERQRVKAVAVSLVSLAFLGAAAAFAAIQTRDYLLVRPEALTVRYKGGGQWIWNRQTGRALAKRAAEWKDPKLFVWGYQSPLYFYSGMDSPTRHFFENDWVKDRLSLPDPLVKRILRETMRDLRADPPALIFTGNPLFPELRGFLLSRYEPSLEIVPEGPFLWVER